MNWTKDRPTVEGYYWTLLPWDGAVPTIAHVHREGSRGLAASWGEDWDLLEDVHEDMKWAGPLGPPEDPKK